MLSYRTLLPANECLLCLDTSGNELLCQLCNEQLPRISKEQRTSYISLQTAATTPLQVYSLFRYTWPVANMQHRFKYHRDHYAGRALSLLLARQCITDTIIQGDWHILPVPMHWRRVWQRRGNHTIFMANIIGKYIKTPIDRKTIRLTRNPQPQVLLDKKQREQNTKRLYQCSREVNNKCFILLDDIVTTGTTMRALAKVLYKQGAREVRGMSVSRSQLH